MAFKPDPCLVRVVPSKKALSTRVATTEDMILFFPFDRVPRDSIASWTTTGRHKEVLAATVDATRAASTPDEVAAAAQALEQYQQENADFPVHTVRRLPAGWEAKAWKGS